MAAAPGGHVRGLPPVVGRLHLGDQGPLATRGTDRSDGTLVAPAAEGPRGGGCGGAGGGGGRGGGGGGRLGGRGGAAEQQRQRDRESGFHAGQIITVATSFPKRRACSARLPRRRSG